ncbi:MAG: NAD(P)H-dependent oxidoreductase [Flavobacteriales bacterium]|nr:NAD(P)H-dependent oxidoreductase [Flavobacteriales bacterium]
MPRILILFAHPRLEKSRINKAMIRQVPTHRDITFRDLYELYPDFNVDIAAEQALLAAHDIVVLHHPFYWYSMPPLLKQYIDLVYAFGWAYGPGGTALKGKAQFHVISTGGAEVAYTPDGFHGHTLKEFMLPLKRTATLCGMSWLPPYVVHGTNRVSDAELEQAARHYHDVLLALTDGRLGLQTLTGLDRLDMITIPTT